MTDPIRCLPFGTTRGRVTPQYALITPDTHVPAPLVGWRGASAVTHVSPEMGARFAQYSVEMGPGAASAPPAEGIERFVFVLAGEIALAVEGEKHRLAEGHFALVPAGTSHEIAVASAAKAPARLAMFEKRYQFVVTAGAPRVTIGDAAQVRGEAFQGDPALRLQTLLPIEPALDMAINLFTYDPGGHLPQVEIHVMEHGLVMLEGSGVYRLADDWFPVGRGDVIWMAPYCPQWFVAMGKTPARYLYYKDVQRDPLSIAKA